MMRVFGEPASKGLDPADYGSLLPARIVKLRSTLTSDVARFDLAMTISQIRYILDLHLGSIHAIPLWFRAHNQYDLSRFVRERLASAPDL